MIHGGGSLAQGGRGFKVTFVQYKRTFSSHVSTLWTCTRPLLNTSNMNVIFDRYMLDVHPPTHLTRRVGGRLMGVGTPPSTSDLASDLRIRGVDQGCFNVTSL